MLHMSKYPSSRSGGPEKVREEFSSRTRTEGNRMADAKKSKMSRRSFLQKTAVGAAAVGAVTAAPTILKKTENVHASPPPGGVNTPAMAYVKDAAPGTGVGVGGAQENLERDPGRPDHLPPHPATSLYNRGPIGSPTDPNGNGRQLSSVTKVGGPRRPGSSPAPAWAWPPPPVRIGPRSTPNYGTLADAAVSSLGSGVKTFAGQRGEGFYVDLGSIFDLGALRPFQNLHLIPTPAAPGVNGTKGFNVHTIAIQVPKTDLTRNGFNPSHPAEPRSGIGLWSAASRRKGTIREKNARIVQSGPWVQVSRLGEPLINEVVIELGEKDLWNSQTPDGDSQFLDDYAHPQLQGLLPALYPGVFPNLAALTGTGASRADLIAILLTGIPSGIIPGFQNSNGPTQADELRLNLAFAPSYDASDSGINPPGGSAKRFGLLGGDLDGFPDGRRVFDNVTAVELRAIAGVTYPLIDSSFTPDAAAGLLMDGTKEDLPFIPKFPYLAVPYEGYEHSHDP